MYFFVLLKNLCNDVNSNTGRVGSIITSLGGLTFGISGDVYGYYKNGQLVGFKSQADIDAAYQSGYNAGVAAGVTNHTGTYNITTNGTTDLGIHHTYRYINTNVQYSPTAEFYLPNVNAYGAIGYIHTNLQSSAASTPKACSFNVHSYSGGDQRTHIMVYNNSGNAVVYLDNNQIYYIGNNVSKIVATSMCQYTTEVTVRMYY